MATFIILCPHCRRELQAQTEYLGQPVDCSYPDCGQGLIVPPPAQGPPPVGQPLPVAPLPPAAAPRPALAQQARVSLWLGVSALFFTCCCLPASLPLSIAALITGHRTLARMRQQGGTPEDARWARLGVILGYCGLALSVLVGIYNIQHRDQTAELIKQLLERLSHH